jgi:hypothetical protein
MKNPFLFALVVLAISLALPAFAQQKDAVDPQTTQKLDANIKAFDEAINNNDATAVAAIFTEDAVFVTDRGPVMWLGKCKVTLVPAASIINALW